MRAKIYPSNADPKFRPKTGLIRLHDVETGGEMLVVKAKITLISAIHATPTEKACVMIFFDEEPNAQDFVCAAGTLDEFAQLFDATE